MRQGCQRDMVYATYKNLSRISASDKVFGDITFAITRNP